MPFSASNLAIIVCGDKKDFLDRQYGTHVWRTLADNGFAEGKSIGGVGFCRDLVNNRLVAVLPKAFSKVDRNSFAVSEYIKKHLYQLIRVFNKLSRLDYSTISIPSNVNLCKSQSDSVLDSLEAALKLRSEFRMNGLYYKKKKVSNWNSSNQQINWSSTVNRRLPFLHDSDIFYHSFIHNSRAHNLQHPLSNLHLSCIREILELVGDRSFNSLPQSTLTRSISSITNPKGYIREISNDVFDERGRSLAKLIQVYLGDGKLKSTMAASRDDLLAYTANFEIVWESILRSLFDRGESRTLPAGKWFSYDRIPEYFSGISPRIDGKICTPEFSAYIDAKDYRVGTGLFGVAGDHYKQIMYRLLTDVSDPNSFFNILIFPGLGQKKLFEIHGCHRWDEIPNSTVYEISVDYEIAVSRWLGDSSFDIEHAVNELFKELKIFELTTLPS